MTIVRTMDPNPQEDAIASSIAGIRNLNFGSSGILDGSLSSKLFSRRKGIKQ